VRFVDVEASAGATIERATVALSDALASGAPAPRDPLESAPPVAEPEAEEPHLAETEVAAPSPEPAAREPVPVVGHRFALTLGPGSSVTGILILESAAGSSSVAIELDDGSPNPPGSASGAERARHPVPFRRNSSSWARALGQCRRRRGGWARRLGGFVVEGVVTRTGDPLTCTPLAP
jgi:hypothetical protein